MSTKVILETTKLTKKMSKELIIQDISLTVHQHNVYGLLGPNGAGKSTILKVLVGLLKPTEGHIQFNGGQWERKVLKDIGFLIEQPPIYGNLSAKENLKIHTILLGLPDIRINEVLEIVDLTKTGKKPASKFSMGMKQRLGIAIAILNKPKLLILDEPTNGLDPLGIQELRELIKSFPKMGMTVIISSHILSEIEQLADEIGIINQGKLCYQGKLPEKGKLEALFMKLVMEGSQYESLY